MYADREEEALARRQRGHRRRLESRSVSPVSPVSRRSLSPSRSPPPSRSYRSRRLAEDSGLTTRERELQEELRRRALRSIRREGKTTDRTHSVGTDRRRDDDLRSTDRRRRSDFASEERAVRRTRSPSPRSIVDDDYSPRSGSADDRQRSNGHRRNSYTSSNASAAEQNRRRRVSPAPRTGYYERPAHGYYDRRTYTPSYEPRSPAHRAPHRRAERERAPRSPIADDYESRSIFCSQLAARLTQRDLGEFFEDKLGEGVVMDVRIVMDRYTGRSKGVGYVELSDEALVGQALGLSGTPLFGIPIIVQTSDAARNGAGASQPNGQAFGSGVSSASSRLYVGNLHFSLTETDVRSVFEPFGAIAAIDLHREPSSQKSKGFAFVQFVDSDVAEKAIQHMDGFELAGRNIRVGHVNAAVTGKSAAGAVQEAAGSTATLTSSFDEGGGGGLTASGRVALMEMLARTDSGTPKTVPEQQRPTNIPQSVSRGILLKNMFRAEEETDRDWDKDLADDVREECEAKYGRVEAIKVDTESTSGEIRVRFADLDGAKKAIQGLNGRFFGGRTVSAVYMSEGFLASSFDKSV